MFVKCKCCNSFWSRFKPIIPVKYLVSDVTIANSSIAEYYLGKFTELCVSCAKDFVDKMQAEIDRIYQKRLEELV